MLAKLDEDQDIPAKMQEAIKQAAEVASEKLGIKVIKNNLTVTGLAPRKPVGAGKGGPEEKKAGPEEDFEEEQKEDSKEIEVRIRKLQ